MAFLFDISPDRQCFAKQIEDAGWVIRTTECIEIKTLNVVEALLDEVERLRARVAKLEGE